MSPVFFRRRPAASPAREASPHAQGASVPCSSPTAGRGPTTPPGIDVRRARGRRAPVGTGEPPVAPALGRVTALPSPAVTLPEPTSTAHTHAVQPFTPSPSPPAAVSPARAARPRLRALAASLEHARAVLVRSTSAAAYGWALEAAVEARHAPADAAAAAKNTSQGEGRPATSAPWQENGWASGTRWAFGRGGVAERPAAAAGPGPHTLASRLRRDPQDPDVQRAALAQLTFVLQRAEEMLERGDDDGAAALYAALLAACAAGKTAVLDAVFVRSPLHADPLLHALGLAHATRSVRVLLLAFARAVRAQAAAFGEGPQHVRARWHVHAEALRLAASLAAQTLVRAAHRREAPAAAAAAAQLAHLHRAAGQLGWDRVDAWPEADVAVAAARAAQRADAGHAAIGGRGAGAKLGAEASPGPDAGPAQARASGRAAGDPASEASAALAWLEAQGCTEAAGAVAEADVASLWRQLWRLEAKVLRDLATGERAGVEEICARLSALRRAHPGACAGAPGHGPARAVAAWLGLRVAVERGEAKKKAVLQLEAVVLPADPARARGWLRALLAFGGSLAQLSTVPGDTSTAAARVVVWTAADAQTGVVAPGPVADALAVFSRPPRLTAGHAFGAPAAADVVAYVLQGAHADLGGTACDLGFGEPVVAELRHALRHRVPPSQQATPAPVHPPVHPSVRQGPGASEASPFAERAQPRMAATPAPSPPDAAAVAFLEGLRQRHRVAPLALSSLARDERCRDRLPPALVHWIEGSL